MGVDLSERTKSATSYKCYAAVCLLLNFASQIDVIVYCIQNVNGFSIIGLGTLKTVTSSWNTVIDFINYAINGILGHLILLFVIRPRWAALIESFYRLEDQLDAKVFIHVRRMTLFATFSTVLWV